ncbi:PKD domain-containing protein [Oopsacas minuta]|uniref:PKD domain-containing protein n=1 Tax=Oopsacas minuta TaxID=111878 RepID=A0AAV7KFC2_9METZ|nr:PKD domain-containing protein [Oopsacas minuta]
MATDNPLERVFSVVVYKDKIQPIVSACKFGKGLENLNRAEGLTIDNSTEDIYVADRENYCVKVFDNYGKILFKFGDEEGEGKMERPIGVAICRDRILISVETHYIMNYQGNGKFVSRIGKFGKGELEFFHPRGLTFDESNGEVYICDCYNNRIQIVSRELRFKSQFGQDNLKFPRDVKLSKEFIFILDSMNPCLHLYNYNHILQKNIISLGAGLDVTYPYFFCIDRSNNIIISDYTSQSIYIFSSHYKLIHKISITEPNGVTVDNQGRVIVACEGDEQHCLHIF